MQNFQQFNFLNVCVAAVRCLFDKAITRMCVFREFTSEILETKTKELSHTIVPIFFRQVCTICTHPHTPSLPVLKLEEDSSASQPMSLCVCMSAKINPTISHVPPPSLSVPTLRGHGIVSELDFSSSLHNYPPPVLRYTSLSLSPLRLPRGVRHRDSNCSWVGRSPHHDISPKTSGRSHSPSITFSESSLSLSQRKSKVGVGIKKKKVCFPLYHRDMLAYSI